MKPIALLFLGVFLFVPVLKADSIPVVHEFQVSGATDPNCSFACAPATFNMVLFTMPGTNPNWPPGEIVLSMYGTVDGHAVTGRSGFLDDFQGNGDFVPVIGIPFASADGTFGGSVMFFSIFGIIMETSASPDFASSVTWDIKPVTTPEASTFLLLSLGLLAIVAACIRLKS
jgi:hypothetical protein